MTELKTLKDLKQALCNDYMITEKEYNDIYKDEGWKYQSYYVDYNEVRKEAIKWIKTYKENKLKCGHMSDKVCSDCSFSDGVGYGFIKFFNLTEDDLKDE